MSARVVGEGKLHRAVIVSSYECCSAYREQSPVLDLVLNSSWQAMRTTAQGWGSKGGVEMTAGLWWRCQEAGVLSIHQLLPQAEASSIKAAVYLPIHRFQ